MMPTIPVCPTAEEMAIFATGAASEQSWRAIVRHLGECDVCRRRAILLQPPELSSWPEPRVSPILPFVSRRASGWAKAWSAVAAAGILSAMGLALALMNGPAPQPLVGPTRSVPRKDSQSPPIPPKESSFREPRRLEPARPEAPGGGEPERSPKPRDLYPPPPSLRDPAPAGEREPAPAPAAAHLAERASRGIVESIEVSAGNGVVTIVSEAARQPLSQKTYLRPTDRLVSEGGGSVVLPDGSTIHLGPRSEIQLGWSQTLFCYSLQLRKDEALIDLGSAPRNFHVGNGAVGVRLQETSGRLLLATRENSLRAIALGPVVFRSVTGESKSLRPREALVLQADRDLIEMTQTEPENLISAFPSLRDPPRPPAPLPPPKDPAIALPDPQKLLRSLAAQGYGYRVSGREVREGAWLPSGILVSTMDEITVARQVENAQRIHFQKAKWVWDSAAGIKGAREEKLLETARSVKAPHLLVQQALAMSTSDSARRKSLVARPGTIVWEVTLDSQKVRPEITTVLEQSIREGRLDRPDWLYWESTEGVLELSTTREDPRLLRAVDRRRVAFGYNTPSGLDRRWYELETVFEFTEQGHPNPRVPHEILKDLDPARK